MRVAFTRMLAASARPSRSIGRMWSRPGHNPIAVVRDRELDPIPLALDYDGIQTFQQARKFCDAKHRFNVVRTFTNASYVQHKPDSGTHCCVISATVADIAPRSCFTTWRLHVFVPFLYSKSNVSSSSKHIYIPTFLRVSLKLYF
jgi:hypothetical protein